MDLERRTMRLYCLFESRFADCDELRAFWFEMAQHESRHFGALALVLGLLEGASGKRLRPSVVLTPARLKDLRRLLGEFEAEAEQGVSLERAFEIALEVEGSEIEEVVFDLLRVLRGEAERERAVKLLIHDLGDLGFMIEKHTSNPGLLERADRLLEHRVSRLRSNRPTARVLRWVRA